MIPKNSSIPPRIQVDLRGKKYRNEQREKKSSQKKNTTKKEKKHQVFTSPIKRISYNDSPHQKKEFIHIFNRPKKEKKDAGTSSSCKIQTKL